MDKLNVYLVDDDDEVRKALTMRLEFEGFTVRPFSCGRDFLEECDYLEFGCLVTDFRMPDMNGIELVKLLAQKAVRHCVIVISAYGDISLAVEAMRLGAVDFLEKPVRGDVLALAIRNALNVEDSVAEALRSAETFRRAVGGFTPREQDVFRKILDGKTNREVAAELGISARTVEIYRANLMAKSGAKNLSSLVRIATSSGL